MPASRLEVMGPFTDAERDALVANANMPPYTIILNSGSGQLEYWDTPLWKGVLGNSISIPGNMAIGGTLGVSGSTSLGMLVASEINATGSLTVDVDAIVLGALGVSGATTIAALTATGAVDLQSTVRLRGATTLDTTLGVTGATSLAGLASSGHVQVNSTLTATGDVVVYGILSTLGNIRLATDTTLQNQSGFGIVKFPGSADVLRIIYPGLVGADADPASGVTWEVRGKELVTGELEIDGALNHDGANVGFYGTAPVTKATATGSRGGNAALASLLTALAATGLIVDSTTA